MNPKVQNLLDNAWDAGLVSGVLSGIEFTPSLLPNQKSAIGEAQKAIERVIERNQRMLVALSESLKSE